MCAHAPVQGPRTRALGGLHQATRRKLSNEKSFVLSSPISDIRHSKKPERRKEISYSIWRHRTFILSRGSGKRTFLRKEKKGEIYFLVALSWKREIKESWADANIFSHWDATTQTSNEEKTVKKQKRRTAAEDCSHLATPDCAIICADWHCVRIPEVGPDEFRSLADWKCWEKHFPKTK